MMDAQAHEVGEAPLSAPRYHGRDNIKLSPAINGGNEQSLIHRQLPTVNQLSHIFLENLKLRFGEKSSEATKIHDIFGKFRIGQKSKRDTLRKIREIVGVQQDLRQDLMKVLNHGDADWAPDDFDFDEPVAQTSPQFLLPDHQPHMRLPPISPSWYADQSTHQLISSSMVGGFGVPVSVSPSMHQMPNHLYPPNAFTSPIAAESAKYTPYTGTSYETEGSPASQHFDHAAPLDHMRIQWGREDDGDALEGRRSQPWSPFKSDSLLRRTRSFASDNESSAPPHEACTPQAASPEEQLYAQAGPSILGTPVVVPIGQPTYTDDMPPPSRKRRRLNSSAHFKVEEDTDEEDIEASVCASPPAKVPSKRTLQRQAKKKAEEEQVRPAVEGPYIHSLCGKGFASRSKVKKHHWGAKLENLETTNGCWAKHNKPDVSWNEHPSCKEGPPPRRTANRSIESKPTQKESKQKAPVVPTMIPTLEDLPRTVYEAVNPQEADQPIFTEVGPFHSHRLPTQDRFNSLLTAAKFASRIEAPRPQGRNDSLISHLNAQAVLAEDKREYCTSWVDTAQDQQDEFAYGHHHPYTAQGLGISYPVGGVHVPLDVALPSQRANYTYTLSAGSPQNADWNQNPTYQFNDARLYQTSLEPDLPPYPDHMRRQI